MKGFKVRYNARQAAKRFKAKFEKFQKEDDWKDEAAELAIKNIQGNTRLSKEISTGGKLKKIASSTKKDKEYWAKKNTPGTSFGTSKSNLTRSGQLLESLERVRDKKKVIVKPNSNIRTPYKGQKKAISNKKLTKYLREKGFIFMGYNDKVKKIILNKLKAKIRRSILRK